MINNYLHYVRLRVHAYFTLTFVLSLSLTGPKLDLRNDINCEIDFGYLASLDVSVCPFDRNQFYAIVTGQNVVAPLKQKWCVYKITLL